MKKNSLKKIFLNNINNKYKLIPYNLLLNYKGDVKYLPPISKEWKDSVYYFNYNITKNLPNHNKNLNKIFRSFFNFVFKHKPLLKNYIRSKLRALSLNKVFISKPEIKHTNSKAIITLYFFNREKIVFFKNIFSSKKNNILFKIYYFYVYGKKYEITSKENYNKFFKSLFYEELIYIRNNKLKFSLNKYKVNYFLLYKLAIFVTKLLRKKIEFNIINSESLSFNSDNFTEFLKLKLKRKKINVMRTMDLILNKFKLPKVNTIIDRTRRPKNINYNLLENKYKNSNLNFIMKKDNLDNIIKDSSIKYKNVFLHKKISLFNSIKYKNIAGIKLRIKGRLSKRYRADRAIEKRKYRGVFKNIDSSFKGLSVVNFRGDLNPNLESSISISKRRIGSFAVKGWISGN